MSTEERFVKKIVRKIKNQLDKTVKQYTIISEKLERSAPIFPSLSSDHMRVPLWLLKTICREVDKNNAEFSAIQKTNITEQFVPLKFSPNKWEFITSGGNKFTAYLTNITLHDGRQIKCIDFYINEGED